MPKAGASQPISRLILLIRTLCRLKKPTLQDLHEATDFPIPTIKRQFSILRQDLGMEIVFVRESNRGRGKHGYYEIREWGAFNHKFFLMRQ